jgi:hypothetical protein
MSSDERAQLARAWGRKWGCSAGRPCLFLNAPQVQTCNSAHLVDRRPFCRRRSRAGESGLSADTAIYAGASQTGARRRQQGTTALSVEGACSCCDRARRVARKRVGGDPVAADRGRRCRRVALRSARCLGSVGDRDRSARAPEASQAGSQFRELAVINADWARVVQARTRHDDRLPQRVWTLRKRGHEP